jgi:hypothetical protein
MNMPYFSLSINFAHESWGQQPQLRNDRCYSADARTVSNAGCQYGFFIHLAPVLTIECIAAEKQSSFVRQYSRPSQAASERLSIQTPQ